MACSPSTGMHIQGISLEMTRTDLPSRAIHRMVIVHRVSLLLYVYQWVNPPKNPIRSDPMKPPKMPTKSALKDGDVPSKLWTFPGGYPFWWTTGTFKPDIRKLWRCAWLKPNTNYTWLCTLYIYIYICTYYYILIYNIFIYMYIKCIIPTLF